MITKEAHVIWQGSGREGKGEITTESKALHNVPYGFATRFENAQGTNPEELVGAAHAACFSMALAFKLSEAGYHVQELKTDAAVVLEKDTSGWSIKEVRLKLQAKVAEIRDEQFEGLVHDAKMNCPISRLLNAQINVIASLVRPQER